MCFCFFFKELQRTEQTSVFMVHAVPVIPLIQQVFIFMSIHRQPGSVIPGDSVRMVWHETCVWFQPPWRRCIRILPSSHHTRRHVTHPPAPFGCHVTSVFSSALRCPETNVLLPLLGLAAALPSWTLTNRYRWLFSSYLSLRPLQRPPLEAGLSSRLLPGLVGWSSLPCEAQSGLQIAVACGRFPGASAPGGGPVFGAVAPGLGGITWVGHREEVVV